MLSKTTGQIDSLQKLACNPKNLFNSKLQKFLKIFLHNQLQKPQIEEIIKKKRVIED